MQDSLAILSSSSTGEASLTHGPGDAEDWTVSTTALSKVAEVCPGLADRFAASYHTTL